MGSWCRPMICAVSAEGGVAALDARSASNLGPRIAPKSPDSALSLTLLDNEGRLIPQPASSLVLPWANNGLLPAAAEPASIGAPPLQDMLWYRCPVDCRDEPWLCSPSSAAGIKHCCILAASRSCPSGHRYHASADAILLGRRVSHTSQLSTPKSRSDPVSPASAPAGLDPFHLRAAGAAEEAGTRPNSSGKI